MGNKVLITGGNGQLGRALKQLFEEDYEVISYGKDELDVSNYNEVKKAIRLNLPNIIIHTAAYTDVEGAEDLNKKELAYLVNSFGTRNVAIEAEYANAKLIYISTDYVFDGEHIKKINEFTSTNPLNSYGLSKLEGENFVKNFHSKFFIVRTSWVFGHGGKNFVNTMLNLSKSKDELRIVNDQIGSPTYAIDLANSIKQFSSSNLYGTYHVTNSGECSWYEFAKEIFRIKNIEINIIPVTSQEFPTKARRPKYSVLENLSLKLNNFEAMPHWKNALLRYLE
ncbi:dTDP-4-dehydrorhamnose reductase [Marinococcus halotolerans]|uniref:dTDP-4-dehydrorhamnose reductase n=1 Tax=Marinococcus halotolerans TaxID=301092 RepID=UPI0003B4AFB5|nr:dTDP-4-dehydrorhamnose reductase [Marinococcus halotolerans]